jgi:hypothetical protein
MVYSDGSDMTHIWTKPQKEWVAALRSGKYKQGRKKLKDGDRFCCLGVACAIYGKGEFNPDDSFGTERDKSELPSSVCNWLKIKSNLGDYSFISGEGIEIDGTLACLNDDYGLTFYQIADFIEEYPEHIFR